VVDLAVFSAIGDEHVREVEQIKQWAEHCDLVGLLVHFFVADDDADPRDHGTEQVHGPAVISEAPTQRLAIERDHERPEAEPYPPHLVERGGVEAPGEALLVGQVGRVLARDGDVTGTGKRCRRRDGKHRGQAVTSALAPLVLRDLRPVLEQPAFSIKVETLEADHRSSWAEHRVVEAHSEVATDNPAKGSRKTGLLSAVMHVALTRAAASSIQGIKVTIHRADNVAGALQDIAGEPMGEIGKRGEMIPLLGSLSSANGQKKLHTPIARYTLRPSLPLPSEITAWRKYDDSLDTLAWLTASGDTRCRPGIVDAA
jgi:hypothetical protein